MELKHVIGIRTHKWSDREKIVYEKICDVFSSENIFFVIDETKSIVDIPFDFNKISLDIGFLNSQSVLSIHPNKRSLCWLCGDYFYYALQNNVKADFYWLIEPDVDFTFNDLNCFFDAFSNVNSDAILYGYKEAIDSWMWKESGKLINPEVYKTFFPISRLSSNAITLCKKERIELTKNLYKKEYPIHLYPNDEVLVATTARKYHLSVTDFKSIFPHSFDYFTYNSKISIYPGFETVLPINQVVHPVRGNEDFAEIIVSKIIHLTSFDIALDNIYKSENMDDVANLIADKLSQILQQKIAFKRSKQTVLNNVMELMEEFCSKVIGYKIDMWQYKDNVVVLDLTLERSKQTIEFVVDDNQNFLCNIFSRKKGDDILVDYLYDTYGLVKKNNKVVFFDKNSPQISNDVINALEVFFTGITLLQSNKST